MTTKIKTNSTTWTNTTNGYVKTGAGWKPIDKIYQKMPDNTWKLVGGRWNETTTVPIYGQIPVYTNIAVIRLRLYTYRVWRNTSTNAFVYDSYSYYSGSSWDYPWPSSTDINVNGVDHPFALYNGNYDEWSMGYSISGTNTVETIRSAHASEDTRTAVDYYYYGITGYQVVSGYLWH